MKRAVKFALLCGLSLVVMLVHGCGRNHSQACLKENFNHINHQELVKIHKEFHQKMLSEQSKYPVNYFRNE